MSMDFEASMKHLQTHAGTSQEELDRIGKAILAMAASEDDGDSWDWFGLSYASWLVLPRVALQSMPSEWQTRFFNMVRELEETIEYPEGYTGQFAVTMKDGNKFVKNCLPPYRHNTLPRKAHQQ